MLFLKNLLPIKAREFPPLTHSSPDFGAENLSRHGLPDADAGQSFLLLARSERRIDIRFASFRNRANNSFVCYRLKIDGKTLGRFRST